MSNLKLHQTNTPSRISSVSLVCLILLPSVSKVRVKPPLSPSFRSSHEKPPPQAQGPAEATLLLRLLPPLYHHPALPKPHHPYVAFPPPAAASSPSIPASSTPTASYDHRHEAPLVIFVLVLLDIHFPVLHPVEIPPLHLPALPITQPSAYSSSSSSSATATANLLGRPPRSLPPSGGPALSWHTRLRPPLCPPPYRALPRSQPAP